ncbi:MAG TPA: fatty acid desaturase [Bacteriovoracaceae bacterium]|nr:fatty acid desaturase [Bacteriovoracaceae bacterium]
MAYFRQKADQLPVALISLFFLCDIVIYLTVDHPWAVMTWFVLSIWPKGNICAWNHHHQHCLTFRQTFLNRLLEVMYGFQTGITSKGWFLHHVVGHHKNYLDQELDESRWMRKNGKTMGEIRYTLEVTMTAYPRIIKTGLKYRKHLRDFLVMFGIQIVLLTVLFYHNWFNALFLFGLPMIIGLTLTSWATYNHHSELDTKNEMEGSRNVLDPFYNLLTGNLGYHTAHHVKHGLHWSKIPEFHASIEHMIPADCYMKAGFPYNWISGTKKAAIYVARPFFRRA